MVKANGKLAPRPIGKPAATWLGVHDSSQARSERGRRQRMRSSSSALLGRACARYRSMPSDFTPKVSAD